MKLYFALLVFTMLTLGCVSNQPVKEYQKEYRTGFVAIEWHGHSTVEITGTKAKIFLDPFVLSENVSSANTITDFIFITHNHFDHCDPAAVNKLNFANHTEIYGPIDCIKKLNGLTNSIEAGEGFTDPSFRIKIKAVDAYNINKSYHPKGEGLGYLITLDGKNIYFSGDTDLIPEMNEFNETIDVAILPIGGKYTMNVEEAAQAVRAIKPKAVIPVHYNSAEYGIEDIEADPEAFKQLVGSEAEVVILAKA